MDIHTISCYPYNFEFTSMVYSLFGKIIFWSFKIIFLYIPAICSFFMRNCNKKTYKRLIKTLILFFLILNTYHRFKLYQKYSKKVWHLEMENRVNDLINVFMRIQKYCMSFNKCSTQNIVCKNLWLNVKLKILF